MDGDLEDIVKLKKRDFLPVVGLFDYLDRTSFSNRSAFYANGFSLSLALRESLLLMYNAVFLAASSTLANVANEYFSG